jgi:outer membrane lipoprotein-sorting protein
MLAVRRTMILLVVASACAGHELTTADQVLDRYKQALCGVDAIANTQYQTIHAEVERSDAQGKLTVVSYAEPFKQRFEMTRPDGSKVISGFDGSVSWTVGPDGAEIDRSTALESVRRDADLQYPLHQPDYFRTLALAGVVEFEGKRCYWLRGTTHWGKDNNQFYDVTTGLLRGYRFQSDDNTSTPTILVFDNYKRVGKRLLPTKMVVRTAANTRTLTAVSVTDDPLPDSLFVLPDAIKALLHSSG